MQLKQASKLYASLSAKNQEFLMNRTTDRYVENLIRQWIRIQEYQQEHIALLKDDEDLPEVVMLPTGHCVTALRRAS